MIINEIYRAINRNQDKLLPAKTLVKCVNLQNEDITEDLKARFLVLILKEFRKNREQNKFRG